jgi:deferrochelatase/peroxidase EfeB
VFGFLDGIGQPAVSGFTITPVPGQEIVNPGIILVGEPGDTVSRPSWAKDGSFLVFRQLQQLVLEFDNFVVNNAPLVPGLTASQASDLLGARMIGRWKSVCAFRAVFLCVLTKYSALK